MLGQDEGGARASWSCRPGGPGFTLGSAPQSEGLSLLGLLVTPSPTRGAGLLLFESMLGESMSSVCFGAAPTGGVRGKGADHRGSVGWGGARVSVHTLRTASCRSAPCLRWCCFQVRLRSRA